MLFAFSVYILLRQIGKCTVIGLRLIRNIPYIGHCGPGC